MFVHTEPRSAGLPHRFAFPNASQQSCPAASRTPRFLPLSYFQSLTNCPRLAVVSEPLSFQALTNCSIFKLFVLITIQNGRRGSGFRCCPDLSLQICAFVFNHFHDAPPATPYLSDFCIVARGWVYLFSLHFPIPILGKSYPASKNSSPVLDVSSGGGFSVSHPVPWCPCVDSSFVLP